MCGIALTTRGVRRLSEMLNELKHRGPDGKGVRIHGRVYIGHRRLAIVDTQHPDAVQPYVKDDHYAIAFNGEIFNYKQLTKSTEVSLLGELLAKEHDLTQLLNGYYAIAFHDIGRNKIVLARDLYGVMPLYYTHYEGHFEAASEKKSLLNGHVKAVPANSKVEFDLATHKITITQFSQPFRYGKRSDHSGHLHFYDASDLANMFVEAVQRTATHSDNGFSVALSGGLDSAMVLKALHGKGLIPEAIITTYTQTTDTTEVDNAKGIVRFCGWEDRHLVVPCEVLSEYALRHAIETPKNPIRDFAFQRHATVAKHSPTKVILCGEGADELGLGYPLNRKLPHTYDAYFKKVSLLKSQATMTLDRVNKAGMMHSKEYRVPFLDLDFSIMALGYDQQGKDLFRLVARHLGIPEQYRNVAKYSNEETIGRALHNSG